MVHPLDGLLTHSMRGSHEIATATTMGASKEGRYILSED